MHKMRKTVRRRTHLTGFRCNLFHVSDVSRGDETKRCVGVAWRCTHAPVARIVASVHLRILSAITASAAAASATPHPQFERALVPLQRGSCCSGAVVHWLRALMIKTDPQSTTTTPWSSWYRVHLVSITDHLARLDDNAKRPPRTTPRKIYIYICMYIFYSVSWQNLDRQNRQRQNLDIVI